MLGSEREERLLPRGHRPELLEKTREQMTETPLCRALQWARWRRRVVLGCADLCMLVNSRQRRKNRLHRRGRRVVRARGSRAAVRRRLDLQHWCRPRVRRLGRRLERDFVVVRAVLVLRCSLILPCGECERRQWNWCNRRRFGGLGAFRRPRRQRRRRPRTLVRIARAFWQ
eukprot:Amastigsp_a520616_11.p3 type:complete len:171 gc:universal Amastigsp_a520616_11:481-993(+)